MRLPPTHMTAGHYGFIGRVGALAIFLGVGTALAMPTAQADADGASSASVSDSSSLSSEASEDTRDGSPEDGPDESPADTGDAPGDEYDSELESSDIEADLADGEPELPTAAEIDSDGSGFIDAAEADIPATPAASPVDWAAAAYARRQIGAEASAATAAETTAASVAQDAVPMDGLTDLGSSDTPMTNQVSPLGTPQQIDRERIATQTARSLPVAFMKVLLRWGFLAAAKEQFALVGGPDAANRAALDDAVDEYALAAAFQQQILNPMDPAVVTQVAPPHSWYGIDVGGSRLLYDNPDTIYRFIPVNKTADYVLTGRIYEGVPADTTFSVLEGIAGTTSTILRLQDLDISADGTFVITVSGDPAAPGQRNHLQLTSRSTLIAARNTLGDWDTEEPMELAVHRVGGPRNSLFAQLGGFVFLGALVNDSPFLTSLVSLIPPLAIAETSLVRGPLAAMILLVRGAGEEAKYMALATTDSDTGELRPPNVMTEPASNAEFLANQLQSNGYFQLADDEALVLTIDPGNSGFFTVPVYNDWTITDDYWNQQTSLNNDQAVANPDGTYTMVVSVADPSVANWVSTGGLNQGIISMRFQNLDPESVDLPTVQSVVVKLEDLEEQLPAGTVFLTPEQRAAQLAARKAGYDKRWAPYPQA